MWPALGLENARHRAPIRRVGAEPVDRLGRKRHQPAGVQQARSFGDGGAIGGTDLGSQSGGHAATL